MATDKQIKANRRNAKLSTGPITAEGKAKSSRNALKHGFTANEAISPEEAVRMENRLNTWTNSAARDNDPLKIDLLRQAVRSYHKVDRIHDCDDAEAARRSRNSEALWNREQAQFVVENVGKLDKEPMVAAYALESTVAGCDWMIGVIEGWHSSLELGQWNEDGHKLFRKLLKFDASDPTGSRRVPDLWFDKLFKYDKLARYCNTPIAELPWEIRVMTVAKLDQANKHDDALFKRLHEEVKPLADKYEQVMLGELARLRVVREKLMPLEVLDREQAKIRAMVDYSPSAKQRARYLKDAERALFGFLGQVREMWKLEQKMGWGPPQIDEEPELAENEAPARNEANSEVASKCDRNSMNDIRSRIKPVEPIKTPGGPRLHRE